MAFHLVSLHCGMNMVLPAFGEVGQGSFSDMGFRAAANLGYMSTLRSCTLMCW